MEGGTSRHTMPTALGGPTRRGRHPASRVRTPKSRLKKRRYHGKRTAIASSSEFPQRRQKWRTGSLPSPHWPQMRSPGGRRVGGSPGRGARRGGGTPRGAGGGRGGLRPPAPAGRAGGGGGGGRPRAPGGGAR